jgi:hypothetical protein
LDVRKLLPMLRRSHHGERQVWRVVHVPSVEAEEQRQWPRDLGTLKQERARTTHRIKGLRRSQGRRRASVHKLPEQLAELRLWDGSPVPKGSLQGILRQHLGSAPQGAPKRHPPADTPRPGRQHPAEHTGARHYALAIGAVGEAGGAGASAACPPGPLWWLSNTAQFS